MPSQDRSRSQHRSVRAGAQPFADACALLAFVVVGVLTHGASATSFVRDLLCFEVAWFLAFRLPLPVRWLVAVTAAVGARAAFVGHFSVAFYLVALAFTAAFVLLGRALCRALLGDRV